MIPAPSLLTLSSYFMRTLVYLYLLIQTLFAFIISIVSLAFILDEIIKIGSLHRIPAWFLVVPAVVVTVASYYLFFRLAVVYTTGKTTLHRARLAAFANSAIASLPLFSLVVQPSLEIEMYLIFGSILVMNLCILSLVFVPRYHNYIMQNSNHHYDD